MTHRLSEFEGMFSVHTIYSAKTRKAGCTMLNCVGLNLMSISKDWDCTVSIGYLCQFLSTLTEKTVQTEIHVFCSLPPVLSLQRRIWLLHCNTFPSEGSLLPSRLKNLEFLCLFSNERCLNTLIILMALSWAQSSKSTTFLYRKA